MPDSKAPNSGKAAHSLAQRCQLGTAHRICPIGQLLPIHQQRLDPLIPEVDFGKGDLLQEQGAGMEVLRAIIALRWARLADWGQVMPLRGLRRQLVNTLLLLSLEQRSQTVRLPTHVALAALLGRCWEPRASRWHAPCAG